VLDTLLKKSPPLRNQITLNDELEVSFWMRRWGISRKELQHAIDKVGNSVAAIRKELRKRKAGPPGAWCLKQASISTSRRKFACCGAEEAGARFAPPRIVAPPRG